MGLNFPPQEGLHEYWSNRPGQEADNADHTDRCLVPEPEVPLITGDRELREEDADG